MDSCKFTSICFIGIVFKSTLNRVFKPYQTNVSCSAGSLITRKPKNEMSKRSKKIGNTDHFKDTFSKKRCPMVTQHQVAEIKYRILAVPDNTIQQGNGSLTPINVYTECQIVLKLSLLSISSLDNVL